MNLVKTPEGLQAFKERHTDLSQRLRSAFLLFDGHRSLMQVLEATSALGVVKDDILALVDRGWLATGDSSATAGATTSPGKRSAPAPGIDPGIALKRYQRAYPMAVSITGALGLKGFRLNLAVEAAMGYTQLVELAPRIRDAAGEKAYMALHRALFDAEA